MCASATQVTLVLLHIRGAYTDSPMTSSFLFIFLYSLYSSQYKESVSGPQRVIQNLTH